MCVDIVNYRLRVGLNHARSARLPPGKRLSTESLLFYLLYIHYRCIGVALYIMCICICRVKPHVVINLSNHTSILFYNKSCFKNNPFQCTSVVMNCARLLSTAFVLWLLLTVAGDIEQNPGPSSTSDSSTSGLSSVPSNDYSDVFVNLNNLVTFTCLNTQSLVSKRDIIESEFNDRDVLLFTETWFNPQTSDDDIELQNYSLPYRNDRIGRVGGGVAIYVKKNMYSSEMTELKMNGLESVWVKVHAKGINILFGVFYRPPDSENHIWDHINYSIDMAISKNIDNVVICGDLNEDQLNPRKIKIRDICLQNSLTQIITEPTYFHESSASLLDLIMVNDSNMIAYYEVGENILGNSVRYHCPVSGIINIEKSHKKSMKRKIWQYHRGNYDSFNGELNNTDWDGLIDDTDLESRN